MKIAEEILSEWEKESSDRLMDRIEYCERVILPAMEEYASQKQSEITDADIEAWAREESLSSGYIDIKLIRYYGMIRGAKAMRNGEIKHNKTI